MHFLPNPEIITIFITFGRELIETHPSSRGTLFKVGDTVLLPEYGGTKIELEDKEYTLLRESDIVAMMAKE